MNVAWMNVIDVTDSPLKATLKLNHLMPSRLVLGNMPMFSYQITFQKLHTTWQHKLEVSAICDARCSGGIYGLPKINGGDWYLTYPCAPPEGTSRKGNETSRLNQQVSRSVLINTPQTVTEGLLQELHIT